MRSKNLMAKRGRGRPKRTREVEISEKRDENQNVKKNRTEILEESSDQLKLFEERFKEAIKTGIDLFHDRISLSAISFKERLAYMIILKKTMSSIEWKLKRLISNKQQMECLARKAIETPKERKDMLAIVEKFVEYKLKSFPGKTNNFKAESVAKHYQCELKCYGITQDVLCTKINDLVKTIEVTEGPLPKIENNPKKIIKILNIKKNICRLCGSKQNLIYSINQKKDDIRFKDVVEYFCRIKVQENENLPHLVCKACKDYIENFSKFSERILNFQNKLNLDAESFVVPDEAIKTEIVDLDYEEDINSYDKNPAECNNESSQNRIEYPADEIEVGANYVCSDDDHVTTITQIIINNHNLREIREDIQETEINFNTNVNEDAQDECDSGMSHEISCFEVSTSTPKAPPRPLRRTSKSGSKELKIILERLPIEYVPSDDEDSPLENVSHRRRKSQSIRERSSSCIEINYESIQGSTSDLAVLLS